MKPIRLSAHAARYMEKRGFTRAEVEEAISDGDWQPAEYGANRLECSKEFPFGEEWNGKHYAFRRVRPIFAEENLEIVVITVYTYYY